MCTLTTRRFLNKKEFNMNNYKRIYSLILVCILAFSSISCKKQYKTECKILEINGGSYLVCDVDDGNAEYNVPIEHIKSNREPVVGDLIIITHSGDIFETYPMSFAEIFEVELKK